MSTVEVGPGVCRPRSEGPGKPPDPRTVNTIAMMAGVTSSVAGLEGDERCEKSEGVTDISGCRHSRFPVHVGNHTSMSLPKTMGWPSLVSTCWHALCIRLLIVSAL